MAPGIAYVLFFLLGAILVDAQQTFWPAAVPLAVRSPYLNTWLLMENGSSQNPLMHWPSFWKRQHSTPWSGFIKIDGINWKFMGGRYDGFRETILESIIVTPTRTIFRVICGSVAMNLTFLSPIETNDFASQSFPLSYMYLDIKSLDGNPHAVELYTDVSGEWTSSSSSTAIQWDSLSTPDIFLHSFHHQVPQQLTENTDISEDSTFYYAMLNRQDLKITWVISADDARDVFIRSGALGNVKSPNFRAIDDGTPVFAYAVNLGNITTTNQPIVWAIGQDHEYSGNYAPNGTDAEYRSPFWKSGATTLANFITQFLINFGATRDRAVPLDQFLLSAAIKVSPNYANLVSLATRQTLASVVVTTRRYTDGSWNASDVKAFMKNFGFNGATNSVETLYLAMPLFLYLDPGYLKILLEPLLEYQSLSSYTQPYAATGFGGPYPNIDRVFSEHTRGVEQSASMLIMMFAHAHYSGDGSLLSRHYSLLKKWVNYLVENTLNPVNQTTADGQTQPNSNLAIKGIIAIRAMSEISKVVGKAADSQTYFDASSKYLDTWRSLAVSGDHIVLRYGDPESNGLVYNLYADKLLKTNFIPEEVYSNQATHYTTLSQTAPRFGPVYDSADLMVTKPHWTLFTAAALRNYSIAETFINMTYARMASSSTPGIFPGVYRSDDGSAIEGEASPVLGAMFSILALDLDPKEIQASAVADEPTSDPYNQILGPGVIAGIALGAVARLVLLCLLVYLCWSRKRPARFEKVKQDPDICATPFHFAHRNHGPDSHAVPAVQTARHHKRAWRFGQQSPPTRPGKNVRPNRNADPSGVIQQLRDEALDNVNNPPAYSSITPLPCIVK